MKRNQKLAAVLALVLALQAPGAAYAAQTSGPRAARPTTAAFVGMLKADTILRRQFAAELNALKPGMDLGPLLAPRDLGPAPATTDRMYAHSTGELLRLVLAHPELIPADPKERKELNQVLKQANANLGQVDLLVKLGRQAQDQFAEKISALQEDLALDGVADDPSALRARLDRIIDGARADYAAAQEPLAVPVQSFVSGTPGSSMILDRMNAAAAAAAKDAAVVPNPQAERVSVIGRSDREGVEGPKFAYLKAGEHTPEREAELKAAGVDIMIIGSPTPEELANLKEENGYFRRSDQNRWVAPVEAPGEYLARRKDAGRDLLKSWEVPVEVGRLTPDVWNFWYEKIYTPFIHSLPAGQFLAPREFSELSRRYGDERLWYVLFKDPETGEPLGGIIDGEFPAPKLMWGHFAAYMPAMKERKLYPDLRATWEEMNLARWLGHTVYSAGLDHNFKGWILGRGLLAHKVAMGFELYPAKELQLFKILNTAKFQKPAGAEGRDEGVVFFTVTEEIVRRYLAAWRPDAAPLMEALLGGDFFSGEVIASAAATVMRHFFTDEDASITPPRGISVERAPLSSLDGK